MNLSKSFDSGLGQYMRKAARQLVGMDLSNSCHQRGWRLHHHGGGVCCVFVLCVASYLVVIMRRIYKGMRG